MRKLNGWLNLQSEVLQQVQEINQYYLVFCNNADSNLYSNFEYNFHPNFEFNIDWKFDWHTDLNLDSNLSNLKTFNDWHFHYSCDTGASKNVLFSFQIDRNLQFERKKN